MHGPLMAEKSACRCDNQVVVIKTKSINVHAAPRLFFTCGMHYVASQRYTFLYSTIMFVAWYNSCSDFNLHVVQCTCMHAFQD